MVGEEVEGTTKANVALLHQSNRRNTKEKPLGRKQPRKRILITIHNKERYIGLVNLKQKPVTKSNDSDGDDDDFVHKMTQPKCRKKGITVVF